MRRFVVLLFLLGIGRGATLVAQGEPVDEEPTTGPKITFHGYLTQAYAQSNGHQFLGITEDGTSDYRTAALQIRADIRSDDAFVVQLSHERLGQSPIHEIKDDVELDWLFYQHRFGDSSVKVGRVQIPFGIYNEVRDVGTLLPFYRPSHNFYGEAVYGSETIDGIVLSRTFQLGKGWGVDADLYYGDYEIVERNFSGGYSKSRVRGSTGVELWLDTPVSGLRIGAGAMRFELISQVLGEGRIEFYHFSVAGDFDRFAVHAEIKDAELGPPGRAFLGYVHLGIGLTDKLTINVQKDFAYFESRNSPRHIADDDRILGVSYALKPALVLKAEHHWSEAGFWLEDEPIFTASLLKSRYWIASLSTSF